MLRKICSEIVTRLEAKRKGGQEQAGEIFEDGYSEQICRYSEGNGGQISYCRKRDLEIWKGSRVARGIGGGIIN